MFKLLTLNNQRDNPIIIYKFFVFFRTLTNTLRYNNMHV